MVIVDPFKHYVAFNPVSHCNAYYAYTTLCEDWIANFGLPEILVTDNGTEFTTTKLLHYASYIKFSTNHVHLMHFGLVEGMNRSLQEYLRCIFNGNDIRYTEWPSDVKLFPLSNNSQITTTLGLST